MACPAEDGTALSSTSSNERKDKDSFQSAQQVSPNEEESPHNSPTHKPSSECDRDNKPAPLTRRRRVESRVSWRAKLMKSLRRKTKRGSVAASAGVPALETSDFSFHQPPREGPRESPRFPGRASNKPVRKGSPLLDLNGSKKGYETVRTALADDPDGLPDEIRGGTPLHYYVWVDSHKKGKTDFLVTLLTAGEVEVNSKTEEGNTALHLAVKKGDLTAVKVLLAFGANVNTVNSRGQTPLDIATTGYINQECRLTVTNAALNDCIRQQHSRGGSPKPSQSELHHPQRSSPLLSKIVPKRPKFIDCHLDGDFEGWVSVDFTDGPPAMKRPVSMDKEVRVRDLTDPVQITLDDTQLTRKTAESRQVSTPKNKARFSSAMVEEDELLRQSYDNILNVLHATGGVSSHKLEHSSAKPISLSGKHAMHDLSTELQRSIRLSDYEDGATILNLYEALKDTVNMKMEELSSLGNNFDEAIALSLQQQEMSRYNKTLGKSTPGEGMNFGGRAGSRVLCLDGGGIRGLIQIEVLSQIERVTGCRIVNLFDWIIGTSTGALIALALTYGNMTLEEVRLLYFKMKSEVFTGSSYGFDTPTLERLLQETFPPHMCMDCMTEPNVLVAAVYKKMAPPQLHFFNNCFNDDFSKQPVWKVARYTTAAPMFFKECDDYVDGGVLANNPSETGLTAIQTFHHSQGSHLPIALVVSIGSGIYPAEALGKIDVQDFLFFGKQWLNFKDTVRKRAKNLIQLLSNALVESETVAENTKARCEGQGIPYYRFSPKLAETVATGETDNGVLINMIISTIVQTVPGMEDLHEQFVRISEANQKEKYRKRIARTTTKVTSV